MSKKRLNLHEQGYKAGDPMWVSWDKRWDGPMRRELMWEGVYQEERLVTTIGFFRYDNREFLALDRTKRPNGCEDIIYIPTPLVKEYGKFHAEQYSTFIRYIFVYNTLVSERLNVRIRRYAEATNYAKVLTGVYNGIPKGENGMIIKYQEPAQPIKYMGGYDKRGNMVLPVNNENGMNNVTLPEVTVTPRNINLAGAVDRGRREAAPYVSTLLTGAIFGPLSVAGGYAGNEAVNKITNVASNDKYKDWADMLSKTTGMNPVVADFFNIGNLAGGFGMRNFGPKLKPVKDMAVGGNKWARARVISKTINKGTPSVEPLPNNVGWGPRQSIHVVHDKNSAGFPKLYFPERWDAIHEGAPEAGIWYQGKFGNPRTAANHSIPGKAEKDLPRDLTEQKVIQSQRDQQLLQVMYLTEQHQNEQLIR